MTNIIVFVGSRIVPSCSHGADSGNLASHCAQLAFIGKSLALKARPIGFITPKN
jgi:hypothetical protein